MDIVVSIINLLSRSFSVNSSNHQHQHQRPKVRGEERRRIMEPQSSLLTCALGERREERGEAKFIITTSTYTTSLLLPFPIDCLSFLDHHLNNTVDCILNHACQICSPSANYLLACLQPTRLKVRQQTKLILIPSREVLQMHSRSSVAYIIINLCSISYSRKVFDCFLIQK